MAITVDSTGGRGLGTGNTSDSFTFTNTAGTYMLISVSFGADVTGITITFDGVAASRVALINTGAPRSYLYKIVNPSTGAKTFAISWATATKYTVAIATFTGVGGLGFTGTTFFSAGTSDISQSLNLSSGETLFGFGSYAGTAASLAVVTGTEQVEVDGSDLANSVATNTGTGSVTVSWSRAVSRAASIITIVLQPSDTTFIGLDAIHGVSSSTSDTTQSITGLQCSGSNRIIVAAVAGGPHNAGRTVTSITYGGVGMTQLGSYFNYTGDGFRWSLWYLVAPSASSGQTLTCTISGAATYVSLGAVSYTGVDQTTPFTTLQTSDDSATPGTVACTSDRDGSWMVGLLASANSGLSLSSGGIERQISWTPDDISFIGDSNSTIADTGSNTFTFAWSSGGACAGAAMMRQVSSISSTSNFFMLFN